MAEPTLDRFNYSSSSSDEETEQEEEIEPDEQDEEYESGFNKWKIGGGGGDDEDEESEDDDEDDAPLKSREQRDLDTIEEKCDAMELMLDGGDYEGADAEFEDLRKMTTTFQTRFRILPKPFIALLTNASEILKTVEVTKESLMKLIGGTRMSEELEAAKEDLEKKTADYRSAEPAAKEAKEAEMKAARGAVDSKEKTLSEKKAKVTALWQSFKSLQRGVSEAIVVYQKELAAAASASKAGGDDKEEARDDSKEQDWSIDGINKYLDELALEKRGLIARYDRFIKQATMQGFYYAVIAASARLSSVVIKEDPNPLFKDVKTISRALETAMASFKLAVDKPHIAISTKHCIIKENHTYVIDGFSGMIVRLHDEIVAATQYSEVTAEDYMHRINHENLLLDFADRVLGYELRRQSKKSVAAVASVMLNIVSPRRQAAHNLLMSQLAAVASRAVLCDDLRELVFKLHSLIMENATDDESKAYSALQVVYHLALHDHFHEARDLFLRCRMNEYHVIKVDTFRVMLNRVVAQLGFSAFRQGHFSEAHSILSELCSKGKDMPELLGQKRRVNHDVRKEIEDRARMVPPHHHIVLEVVETAFFLLSMLIDMVADAKNPFESQNLRNKAFQNYCKHQDSQSVPLPGPATDNRGRVFAAYQAMLRGDVQTALTHVRAVPAWVHMHDKERILGLVEQRVKEDALRVFLLNYGKNVVTLTVDHLAAKFLLEGDTVYAIVSRLMLEGSVLGYWDHDERSLFIERGTMSKLHHLAKESGDRIQRLAAYNEDINATHHTGRHDHHRGRTVWGGGARGGRGGGRGGH